MTHNWLKVNFSSPIGGKQYLSNLKSHFEFVYFWRWLIENSSYFDFKQTTGPNPNLNNQAQFSESCAHTLVIPPLLLSGANSNLSNWNIKDLNNSSLEALWLSSFPTNMDNPKDASHCLFPKTFATFNTLSLFFPLSENPFGALPTFNHYFLPCTLEIPKGYPFLDNPDILLLSLPSVRIFLSSVLLDYSTVGNYLLVRGHGGSAAGYWSPWQSTWIRFQGYFLLRLKSTYLLRCSKSRQALA